jgi:hypothetical protein
LKGFCVCFGILYFLSFLLMLLGDTFVPKTLFRWSF